MLNHMQIFHSIMDNKGNSMNIIFHITNENRFEYRLSYIEFPKLVIKEMIYFDELVIPNTVINQNLDNMLLPIAAIGNDALESIFKINEEDKLLIRVNKIVISNGIKKVYPYCFKNANVRNIIWSETCECIDEQTFFNSNVEVISNIQSVKNIKEGAFKYCRNLKTLHWPDNVENISDDCFYSCSKLKTVTNLNNVRTIGLGAFSYTAISEIELPNSCTYIAKYAFSNCKNIERFRWPQCCTIVPPDCFFASNIKELDIQNCCKCIIKDKSLLNTNIISSIYNDYIFDIVT